MKTQLVIVESPAKAKTIESFLGSDYYVLSSYGHVRDLPTKDLAIDVDNNFQPTYVIPADKKERVKQLQKAARSADTVWLATDEDREGEAIAWHLQHALKLEDDRTKRIAFHEITKSAVTQAIDNPRSINTKLVDAQQARRVLDRLVGYKLSPLLWKKIQRGLSAGRVQSVAVRLIVEREQAIEAYQPERSYKITAQFRTDAGQELPAEYGSTITETDAARSVVTDATEAGFVVDDVTTKPATRKPAPPFTTSTLQQTAARKLGFSVRQTMTLAQRLYEAGHITYMRTDSVALAESAVKQAVSVIKKQYGSEYAHTRTYQSASDAQEAHEAIRPTDFGAATATKDEGQQKLYQLIRSRALASQMAEAKLQKTVVDITDEAKQHTFKAKGETVQFPGWLSAYQDSGITDTILPEVKSGNRLTLDTIEARQTLKRAPARYSEASLVRKLESMGIGRPSTYAPTISTIQDRGYVEKTDVAGTPETITVFSGQPGQSVSENTEEIRYGKDKNKLLPTQIALLVNDFLVKHFPDIVDYDFTKEVEEKFDAVARGEEQWQQLIANFYQPFARSITSAESLSREEASGAQELGTDPQTGEPIIARMGKYGPMLQRGHAEDGQKPKFAPVPPGKKLHEITLEEALELLQLPRSVGTDTDDSEITASYGPYGPYVRSGNLFAPIPQTHTPLDIDEETAQELLADKRKQNAERTFADFGNIKVLKGKYGPYVTDGKKRRKIPDDTEPASVDEAAAKKILAAPKPTRGRKSKKPQK